MGESYVAVYTGHCSSTRGAAVDHDTEGNGAMTRRINSKKLSGLQPRRCSRRVTAEGVKNGPLVAETGGPFRLAPARITAGIDVNRCQRESGPGVTRINLFGKKLGEPRRAVVLSGKSFV